MRNKCENCDKQYNQKHANQKYCPSCRLKRDKNGIMPKNVNAEMVQKIKNMAGIKKIDNIAKEIGISRAGVKRVGKALDLSFFKPKYDQNTIKEVLSYYDMYGKPKSVKKFPNIAVRTIIEGKHGNRRNTRCRPWTDRQIIQLIRMAGIITSKQQ